MGHPIFVRNSPIKKNSITEEFSLQYYSKFTLKM